MLLTLCRIFATFSEPYYKIRHAFPNESWKRKSVNLNHDINIMVEGLPRSANSFCASAIELAFQPNIHVGGHRHVFASVQDSIDKGTPVIVMIREPSQQIASLLMKYSIHRNPSPLVFNFLLRFYKRYYSLVLANIDAVILIDFNEITNDLDTVLKQVSSQLNVENLQQVSADAVFQRIKEKKLLREEKKGDKKNFSLTVAYPTKEKEAIKKELIAKIQINDRYLDALSTYNKVIEIKTVKTLS